MANITDGSVQWAIRDKRVAADSSDNSTRLSTTAWIRSNIQSLVAGCIAAVATAAGFAYSFGSTNGYIKFPSWLGGLIIQWGQATEELFSSGIATVTTGIAFPSTFQQVFAVHGGSSPKYYGTLIDSTSQFRIFASATSVLFARWFAIGR
ncbi:putative membrane protein [Propionispora sp. 2/2-37]|uniref:gp53-like domain-containing protein n=1 Tax=Propionispora sp. 2/2-37 TaxID=1677858 RepID=UPI0006BB739C|nr:hypothetical protein [Propionispora sp. 2/2-37]CUH95865.1 putative membrane protein [Propionispora sp. 2/2-37]